MVLVTGGTPGLKFGKPYSESGFERQQTPKSDRTILPEYPDPVSAACITSYPWLGQASKEDECSTYTLYRDIDQATPCPSTSDEESNDKTQLHVLNESEANSDTDPEYLSSECVASNDDIMSNDGEDVNLNLSSQSQNRLSLQSDVTALIGASQKRAYRKRRLSRRSHEQRSSGLGKGARGMKRGLRKPFEPGLEVSSHLSEATMAFTNGNFERAEICALTALKLNPEVFQAHNLLAEIHAARGDYDKSIRAAWNGAHTRPRDVGMWERVAALIMDPDRVPEEESLKDALYCYSRILAVDRYNVEARSQRAMLNRKLGRPKKVIAEYEYLLRYLPQDMSVLRQLADICIESKDAKKALQHYQSALRNACDGFSVTFPPYSWSDVNIVAELYIASQRYGEGLIHVKTLCRALLGRREEIFWKDLSTDDREWDLEDSPRRIEVPGFCLGRHDRICYGEGLLLEIRIKLGIFRLCLDEHDMTEAMQHFGWLEPQQLGVGSKLFDYPDLFRETANALRRKRKFKEALCFLEPLQLLTDHEDSSFLMELASCYRATGNDCEAERCYKLILGTQPNAIEARIALWNMSGRATDIRAGQMSEGPIQYFRQSKSSGSGKQRDSSSKSQHNLPQQNERVLRLTRSSPQLEMSLKDEIEISALHSRWKGLGSRQDWNKAAKIAWFEAANLLQQIFRNNKYLYSRDRNHWLYGYSHQTRSPAVRNKLKKGTLTQISEGMLVVTHGDDGIASPNEYLGLSFSHWLDIFLEYAVESAKEGDSKSAYECITNAASANVFEHSSEALLLIHTCWFTCALLVNDEETLCNVTRWFITNYQFVTDSYHLFSALNRLCDSQNEWFNCGPSQKYILRQMKAVDRSFLKEEQRGTVFWGRGSFNTKGVTGQPIEARNTDIALLMLYGHILYAGKSYAYAVNYFLRALSTDPTNSSIKFSLALAYIHWALKRQADNRHHILMQGLAFLMEYHRSCEEKRQLFRMQEAEYNIGRIYHLLGLAELAVPYYERCLELGLQMDDGPQDHEVENFTHEAAIALQAHWTASGDVQTAHAITQAWLIM